MPVRATKRGDERTPLSGSYDVLICGASFAGLAVARELAGSGAKVLMIDRYEIGERATSACGIPTEWLKALDLMEAFQQEFAELVVHTPYSTAHWQLPWTFSTFDYRKVCSLLFQQGEARFETAKVEGRNGNTVITDRGELSADLIVDGLGWRRILAPGDNYQPPNAPLSRGLEVHPHASGPDLEVWLDRSYIRRGYGWSFPADHEMRVGVGSFDPNDHVKEPTVRLANDVEVDPVNFQGNWIPHKIRPATEDGIFFAGDSAGHCLPLTAEGIRPALYFGLALGRELRAVIEGRQAREQALERYSAFSADHTWKYEWMLRSQRWIPRLAPRLSDAMVRSMRFKRLADFSFNHYLKIAPAEFVEGSGSSPRAVLPERQPVPSTA